MMDILIKSVTRRKLIGLFGLNPKEYIYAQQAAYLINESPYAVGLELKHLVSGGLLKQMKRGNHRYFKFNESSPYAAPIIEIVNEMQRKGDIEISTIPSLARMNVLSENLDRFVDELIQVYDPQKIIVFGSIASTKIKPNSDIDLVIVKETHLPYFKRVRQLVNLMKHSYDVDIDFFIYTPAEFEDATQKHTFLRNEIVEKGRVLYDKAS